MIDHETWITRLDKANSGPEDPAWERLYSARQAYGLTSLSPSDWNGVVNRIVEQPNMFDLFYK